MPRSSRYKKKSVKKSVSKLYLIALVINILAAIALLLSYLAPDTDPRNFILIPLLQFVYFPLIALNLLFIIFWLIRKKAALTFISLIAIAIGYSAISKDIKLFSSSKTFGKKDSAAIRLMQYNVNMLQSVDTYDKTPTDPAVFNIIRGVMPDILTIEEFFSVENKQLDSVKKIMNTNYAYYKTFKTVKHSSSKLAYVGNVIFSKYPIIDTGSVNGPSLLGMRAIYADIKKGKDTIRVYCLHLSAVSIHRNQKSGYLKGNIKVGQSSFIAGMLSAAFVTRSYQVDRIKRNIDSCRYKRIIAGDFNDTPNSFSVNAIGNGLKNCFQEKGSGYVTTYYSKYPLQIDHIFVSQEFNVLDYSALNDRVSDHKPVIADVSIK